MSHHRANTRYGLNTTFFHQESILRPKTTLRLMYLDTFTNLTLNNIQKYVFCLFFKNCPTIAQGNKIQISLEEVTSITKTSTVCSTQPIRMEKCHLTLLYDTVREALSATKWSEEENDKTLPSSINIYIYIFININCGVEPEYDVIQNRL